MLGYDGDAPGPEAIGDDAARARAPAVGVRRPLRAGAAESRRRGRSHRAQRARAPPCLPADRSTPRPRGCRAPSSSASRRRSRTTASRASTARPPWRTACYRIFLATQRTGAVRPSVLALLDRLLERPPAAGDAPARGRSTRSSSPPPASTRSSADLAREVRFRCFDEPRHRRGARARLRRDGGARRGARRRARGPGSRRADQRARRLHAAAGADAAAADGDRRSRAAARAARGRGPPLLPGPDARGLRRARDGRGARCCARPTGTKGRGGASPRVRGPRRPRRRDERLRRLGRRRPRRRPRRRRLLRSRDAEGDRPPSGCARRSLSTVALPASVHRIVVGAAPADAGRGMSAIGAVHLPARPGRAGRGRGAARPAPDDGPSAAPVAAERVRDRAPAVGRGRLPLPRHGPLQPEGRAAVRRSPRSATSRRCATRAAGSRRSPSSSSCSCEALEGIRRFQARRKPSRRLRLEPDPAARVAGDRPAAGRHPGARRAPGAPDRRPRRRDADRPRATCARLHGARPRAAPLRAGRARRRRRDRRSAHAAAATARRGRPARDRRAPARDAAPGRDRQAARARARRERAARGPAGRRVHRARPRRRRPPRRRSTARPRATPAASSSG